MTTHRSTWKHLERQVAKFFGSVRNALSGRNSKVSASDSIHPTLFIECKLREKMPVWDLWEQSQEFGNKEGKTAVVALKKKGKKGFLLVIHCEDLAKVCEEAFKISVPQVTCFAELESKYPLEPWRGSILR